MKLSDEFKVGVFAVVSLTILIMGFNFLKGRDIFAMNNTLYAKYRKIDGLSKANPVFFYGLQIGKVTEIKTSYDEYDSLVITVGFSVSPEVRIPKGSIAKISKPDILASMAIEIWPGDDETDLVQDGEFLKGINEVSLTAQVSAVITPLRAQTEKLMRGLNETIDKLEKTLDQNAQDDIKTSIRNFRETSTDLRNLIRSSKSEISGVIKDFEGTASSVNSSAHKLDETLDNVNAITRQLKEAPIDEAVMEAKTALANLNTLLEATEGTEGTLGLLLNDPKLYNDLDAAIKSIDALANDLKNHPKNYFSPLGKKNP
ncbi:MCE family protein [bacterium]|nr:MCE family protein [bacterium]